MVNPAYPPQMQMPPPQGMPGRPMPAMGSIPQANMVRRGTPKAVPIVVSAGLAVGVFCGLYFGLGTGEKDAKADAKQAVNAPPSAAPATDETTNFQSGTAPPSAGKPPADPTAGSGATPTDVAGTTPTTPTAPTPPTPPPAPAEVSVELTFEVTPPDAEITIDDAPVTGGKATITFTGDEKTIRVVAKANGYKGYDKKITVAKDATAQSIPIKLSKKGGGGSRPPRDGGGRDRDPPGGLIDL